MNVKVNEWTKTGLAMGLPERTLSSPVKGGGAAKAREKQVSSKEEAPGQSWKQLSVQCLQASTVYKSMSD